MSVPRIASDPPSQPADIVGRVLVRAALIAWVAIAMQVGCRSRAKQDLYRENMASEIRALEDQLYEADYANRVLADKLRRANEQVQDPDFTPQDFDSVPDRPRRDRREPTRETGKPPGVASPEPDPAADRELTPDFDLDDIDAGVPMGPGASAVPDSQLEPAFPLPPPGGPEPPGASDLKAPELDSPDITPPPPPGTGAPAPAGRIELDNTMKLLGRPKTAAPPPSPPTELRLHKSLSGSYRFDSETGADGMMLVVTAVDEAGNVVDLNEFDVEAGLTIVALDPTRAADNARVGRWEFEAAEVKEWIRSRPVSGLHVPVKWQQERPDGEEVMVHVRLKSEDEVMQCEGLLNLSTDASMAKWTPRGDSPRRE